MTGDILVIRGGAIGDFILTLPALAALRKTFPQSRLEILGYPRVANLAVLGKVADAAHPIEDPGLTSFFVQDADLPVRWMNFFSGFSLIISYAFDPERILETNIKRCTKAEFITAPHRPGEFETIHATTFFLAPLKQIGLTEVDTIPRLGFPQTPSAEVSLALHPGSGSSHKNWPEENWIELLTEILARKKWRCLLIGGEAEGDRLQRFRSKLPSERLELAYDLPLTDLAQRLRSCTALIGHDSGITHLAAALGLPVVVLWGPTNENIWCPLGKQIVTLRGHDKLSELRPSTVLDELERILD